MELGTKFNPYTPYSALNLWSTLVQTLSMQALAAWAVLHVQHYCKMLKSNHKNAWLRDVHKYHVCNAMSAVCSMHK